MPPPWMVISKRCVCPGRCEFGMNTRLLSMGRTGYRFVYVGRVDRFRRILAARGIRRRRNETVNFMVQMRKRKRRRFRRVVEPRESGLSSFGAVGDSESESAWGGRG